MMVSGRSWSGGVVLAVGLPGAMLTHTAQGQNLIDPYVAVRVEHDSNVYRLENSEQALLQNGDPTLADTDKRYIAGLDGTYLWGLQKFIGKVEISRLDYDRFSNLNHNEYLTKFDFDWKLSTLVDGTLDFAQRHYQAPFADRDSTQLEVDTERNVFGKFNVILSPEWRLETTLRSFHLDAPLQLYPNYIERDTEEDVGLKYLGTTNLTYGMALSRIEGKFENAPNVAPYTQSNANLNLQYTVSALTALTGAVGYTHRDQGGGLNTVSGLTGDIAYNRQLTAKTSVKLEATRAVNSYLAAGGSEIDSSALATVTWQATFKIGVVLGYSYVHSTFIGQAIADAQVTNRVDNSPAASVDINYQVFRQLLLHAYYHQQDRHSNSYDISYSDAVEGLELTARWR